MTKNKKPFSFTNVMKSVVLAATIVAAIMPCKALVYLDAPTLSAASTRSVTFGSMFK